MSERQDAEAVRLIAELLSGTRSGWSDRQARDLARRAESWLLAAELPETTP
jgi:hypothetical protein